MAYFFAQLPFIYLTIYSSSILREAIKLNCLNLQKKLNFLNLIGIIENYFQQFGNLDEVRLGKRKSTSMNPDFSFLFVFCAPEEKEIVLL
jgi:hypothetical protein